MNTVSNTVKMTTAMIRELGSLKTHPYVLVRPADVGMHKVYEKLVTLGYATAEYKVLSWGKFMTKFTAVTSS